METTVQASGEEARQNEDSLAAARDEAVRAERLRASTIRAIATGPFQVEESFLTALIDEGVSIDVARERIMTKVDAEFRARPTVPINPPSTASPVTRGLRVSPRKSSIAAMAAAAPPPMPL